MTAHPGVQLPLCPAHYLNYHENTTARSLRPRPSLPQVVSGCGPIFKTHFHGHRSADSPRSLALTLFSLLSSFNAIHERDGERAVVRLSGRRRRSCHRVMLSLVRKITSKRSHLPSTFAKLDWHVYSRLFWIEPCFQLPRTFSRRLARLNLSPRCRGRTEGRRKGRTPG